MKNQDILVIFDLDGVLMESKMLHFEALNKSLAKFNISICLLYTSDAADE